jgi:Glyoxalase/Bleomycin resistance protein/Dioxygenase superfamily
MKPPFTLGVVGHFGLAVRDPKKSAQWFQRVLGLRNEFEFENGVAVGNENITIVLFKGKPSPETLGHMSFHLPAWPHCERRLTISRSMMLIWKTRATRSGRKPPAHPIWVFGFTISMAIAGSCQCKGESDLMIRHLVLCNEAKHQERIALAWGVHRRTNQPQA